MHYQLLATAGNLYVADDVKHQIYYLPAGSTIPQSLFLQGMSDCDYYGPYYPAGVAINKKGRLYVSCPAASMVLVYKLPNTQPIASLKTGMNEPYFMYFDHKNVMYVANYGAGTSRCWPRPITQKLRERSAASVTTSAASYALSNSPPGRDERAIERGRGGGAHVLSTPTASPTFIQLTYRGRYPYREAGARETLRLPR